MYNYAYYLHTSKERLKFRFSGYLQANTENEDGI